MSEYKYRSRNHLLVLYPDNEIHDKAISFIMENWKYALAYHDLDTDEDGNLKKLHVHIVLSFDNAVWNTAIAEQLNIEPRFFEQCKDLNKSLRYLVHADTPHKYQYSNDYIIGTLAPKALHLLANKDEGERAMSVFKIIDSKVGTVSYTEVFKASCELGLYSDFRRMGTGVIQLIKEHNRPDIILGDF